MDPEIQKQADSLFERALEETGAADPREPYRGMLRELKTRDPSQYDEAVAVYGNTVLRAIVEEGSDPIRVWLEFGRELAQRLHPGRDVVIDDSGRARTLDPPASWESLVLHLPDDARTKSVPIVMPPEPTHAQRATVELLSLGRNKLWDR